MQRFSRFLNLLSILRTDGGIPPLTVCDPRNLSGCSFYTQSWSYHQSKVSILPSSVLFTFYKTSQPFRNWVCSLSRLFTYVKDHLNTWVSTSEVSHTLIFVLQPLFKSMWQKGTSQESKKAPLIFSTVTFFQCVRKQFHTISLWQPATFEGLPTEKEHQKWRNGLSRYHDVYQVVHLWLSSPLHWQLVSPIIVLSLYFCIGHNVVLYVFQITILWLDREEAHVPGDQVGEGLHQADEVKESQRGVWSAWPHPSDILMCMLATWTKLTMSGCNFAFMPSEAHTHYSVRYSLIYFISLLLPAKPQRKHDYHILKE